MPYRRRKKYVPRKRVNYRNCSSMVARDASKALTIALGLKKLVNVEIKSINTTATDQASANASIITAINLSAQGLDTEDRIGNSIKLQFIKLDYCIQIHASATDTAVRCMVILDRQAVQALPALALILQDATPSDNIVSPRHKDFKQRFTTLYDKVHIVSANGSGKRFGSMYKKILAKVRYDAAGGTIAALETNSLTFIHMTDEATNVPTITWASKVGFVDN